VTRLRLAGAALAALLAGCAASPPLKDGLPASAPRAIALDATPFFPQEDFQCGPAALATLTRAVGGSGSGGERVNFEFFAGTV
jgi:hypothetical protein